MDPVQEQTVARVLATPAALDLIATLSRQNGTILFHQSGGCCDGSAPMCYAEGDFLIGDNDLRLGEVGGAAFYMSRSQFAYWEHSQILLDVASGRGGMFSLESGSGQRFVTHSRVFSDEEVGRVAPV